MRVWINGRLAPAGTSGAIDALDQGFSVGHGVFQTLKAVDGVPFALDRHLARLKSSSSRIGLPPPALEDVREGLGTVLEELRDPAGAPLPLARIRITWTGGATTPGPGAAAGPGTLVVQAGAMTSYPATASAVGVPWVRNERGALTGIKSVSFGENRVALARAQELGADEAIFANTRDEVCEGATSNIFYVLDGELLTPTLASGCLAGVTRELVLEWSGATEVDAPLRVLEEAEEILLTSTTRNVQPVTSWQGRPVSAGRVGAELVALWRSREREHLTG